jgi:putrescine aminotransferase
MTHTEVTSMSSHWRPMSDMSARTPPFVIEQGDGSWITDVEGNRYLDATAALWFAQIGFGRREIADAIHSQAMKLHAYHTFGDYSNSRAIELADRLDRLAPGSGWKVFFTSGGSDSVDSAIKFARRYWRARGMSTKSVVISRQGAYHGMHVGGTELSGLDLFREGFGTLLADTARVDRDDPADLERAILEAGPDRVAAFICEPILGAGGMFFPHDGYLHAVRSICKKHDVLFIVDEVVTAFGRAGHWFASERFGLDPDLIVCAKGITSGYVPLGAVLVSGRVAAPFWEGGEVFRHGYTYSGHAVAMAAALANLDYIDDHGLLEASKRIESRLPRLFAPLTDLSVVHSIRTGPAALAAVQFDPDRFAADPSLPYRAVLALRAAGVLTRPLSVGAVQLSPALTTSDDELEEMAERFHAGLRTFDQYS